MRVSLTATAAAFLLIGCGTQVSPPQDPGWDPEPTGTPTGTDPHQPPTNHCGAQTFAVGLNRVNPNVMLVIDRSGSMTGQVGSTKKWDALKSSVHSLLAQHGDAARWGLALFPKRASPQCTTGEVDLALGDNQVQPILSTIDSIKTNGDKELSYTDPTILGQGTPTAETLDVVKQIGGLTDATRENIVLLMTDGIPNCGSDPETRVTDTISALYAMPVSVKTYVVGLGSETNTKPELLTQWAQAGHTERAGTPGYYQANTANELTNAFLQIVGGVVSCQFALTDAPADTGLLEAFVNGKAIANDAVNGATYDAASNAMVFHGAACDAIKAGGMGTVDVYYGCPAGPIL